MGEQLKVAFGVNEGNGGPLMQAILNLSQYHREHEKSYAKAPLQQAVTLQKASGVLKTLGDRWTTAIPEVDRPHMPMEGCEDLNEAAAIQQSGVLFMEGDTEPTEILRLKRTLRELAEDFESDGAWLGKAVEASWQTAEALISNIALADVLGERHRIIANDWQNADHTSLTARILRRSLAILGQVDLARRLCAPIWPAPAYSLPISTRLPSSSIAPRTWPPSRRFSSTTTSVDGACFVSKSSHSLEVQPL